jgi:hypothetical protein
MTRIHAFVISLAVAFAFAAGAFAAFRTTQLGATSTPHVSPVVLAAQSRKLDESASKLHQALGARLPALPPVPKVRKPKLPSGTPPAIVRVVHVAAPAVTTTTTAAPASPATTVAAPAAPTRAAVTTRSATRTTTTPAVTTRRTHERESGEHETGGDDSREHATTTTTPADD